MEEGVGLLPSPNWYGSQLADWASEGAGGEALCAFAARNSVLLLRPLSQRVAGSLTGHTNRVTALAFLRAPGVEHLLLTGCADRAVRLWDTHTLRCVRTLRGHAAEVTALAASPQGRELGVSADKGGTVLLWRAAGSDAPVPAAPALDSTVLCLAFSPAHAGVVAAGCASGAVALLDVAAGVLLRRLTAHAGDAHAVAFTRLPDGGALLASGGRDRALHLWQLDVAGAAALRHTLHVPKAGGNVSEAQRERLWVALAWLPQRPDAAAPLQLAASGFGGDVFVCDVQVLPALTLSPLHKLGPAAVAHTRSVFSIAPGAAAGRRLALTISMDRALMLWDVDALAHVWTLPGLGGFVYALAASPLSPQHVAVACGDKTIRLWEPRAGGGAAKTTLLWKGIGSGKVLALAFHPEREGVLAFGTEEGRVGVYDVFTQAHAAHAQRHTAAIMALTWRRVPGAPARLSSLAADGVLLEWVAELALSTAPRDAPAASEGDATRTLLSDEPRAAAAPADAGGEPGHITDAAWTPDGALLAVGRERGALEVWRCAPGGAWACATRVWAHAKGVTRVRWHPDARAAGARRLLSTAADGTLCACEVAPDGVAGALAQAQAHKRCVQDAAWSPQADALLATASVDGTARVWDAAAPAAAAPLAVLRGHDGRVLAVCWSGARGDTLFTGSEDQTVRAWQWQHERHVPRVTAAAPAAAAVVEAPPPPPQAATAPEPEPAAASAAAAPAAQDTAKPAAAPAAPEQQRRRRPAKPLLSAPACDASSEGRQALRDACVVLAGRPTPHAAAHAASAAGLPLGQEQALAALLLEERKCSGAGAGGAERAATLALFRGDVGAAAEALLAADALTAEFVSASAGAGHAVWARLTAAYAAQLEARGEAHAAALQWLALHDVRAAVGALRRAGLARDAAVLATSRLLPDDALLPVLRAELGAAEENSGAYESAALCYAAAGQPQAAARALSRRAGDDGAAAAAAALLQAADGSSGTCAD